MKLQGVQLQNRGGAHFSYISSRRNITLAVAGVIMLLSAIFGMATAGKAGASQADGAQTSKVGGPKFQQNFKKKFLPIRKALKTCNKAKIRRANRQLNRLKRQIPKLAMDSRWKDGVSRWIARYAEAVAAHGMGQKAKAKRKARHAMRLSTAAAEAAAELGRPPWGPSSTPSIDSMASGIVLLADGDYICGRGE